jgi:thiamine biosynthesis lipoprotein
VTHNATNFISKDFYALGTINNIKIYDFSDTAILDIAVNRINNIERHMSAFLPDSDIGGINKNAGAGYVSIHEDTYRLLERGLLFSKLSEGAFDMTVRPLVELWGIGKKLNYIPQEEAVKKTMELVNYKDLLLDKKQLRAKLKFPGQAIDLGGIAKGYAADEVKRILKENNIRNALINLGGNVVTMGRRPDDEPWQIGIQNPLAPTGSPLGRLALTNKTIVTSGSNERFFIKNGIRYHHLLNPRTGKPAQSSLLSVTVVTECSADADALTTALFVLGIEAGLPLLKKYRAEAIFITDQLGIYLTEGLKDIFTVNMLKHKSSC